MTTDTRLETVWELAPETDPYEQFAQDEAERIIDGLIADMDTAQFNKGCAGLSERVIHENWLQFGKFQERRTKIVSEMLYGRRHTDVIESERMRL